jgi:small subunit ribosomal protein S8
MSMTDPIGDLLARVRNGAHARKDSIDCPWSMIKERIARVLVAEGFLRDCSVWSSTRSRRICACG